MTPLRAFVAPAMLALTLACGGPAWAQDQAEDVAPAAPAAGEDGAIVVGGDAATEGTPVAEEPVTTIVSAGPDYAAWDEVATRAEQVVGRGQGSTFVLRRLRVDIVDWRDLFLAEQSVNARRIETVMGQIAALGPPRPKVSHPRMRASRTGARRWARNWRNCGRRCGWPRRPMRGPTGWCARSTCCCGPRRGRN